MAGWEGCIVSGKYSRKVSDSDKQSFGQEALDREDCSGDNVPYW